MPFPLTLGGPDIPEELLEALETERLVLFCGAGVSKYPASGLPLFGELVDHLYKELSADRMPDEARAEEAGQLDRVLSLLETRYSSEVIRRLISKRLGRRARRSAPLTLHADLLALSRRDAGGYRLVTTNFDRRFEEAARRTKGEKLQRHLCAALPVPRFDRWDSVVHLHGHIDEPGSMVLTSADLGRAYLTERWASRFVTELFRHFTVLFVGYSLKDPVVAYLIDALAAERGHGLPFHDAFVIAAFTPQLGLDAAKEAWRLKGVEPVLYPESGAHREVHELVSGLLNHRNSGLTLRRSIALRHAMSAPDDVSGDVARAVAWALREPSLKVAREFVLSDPTPDVRWLTHVFAPLDAHPPLDANAPLTLVRQAASALTDPTAPPWQAYAVNRELAWEFGRLLVGSLAEIETLRWVIRRGGRLAWPVRAVVRERLSQSGDTMDPQIWSAWSILASEIYAARGASHTFTHVGKLELPDGRLDPIALRDTLLQLSPLPKIDVRVELAGTGLGDRRERPALQVDLLAGDMASVALDALRAAPSALAASADQIGRYLLEALEIQARFGGRTRSPEDVMPSIAPHDTQDRPLLGWEVLIELARDAMDALVTEDLAAARALMGWWATRPYNVMKRLALHAVTEHPAPSAALGVDLLLEGPSPALWADGIQREMARFLRLASPRLPQGELDRLYVALRLGPPREQYSEFTDEARKQGQLARDWWLRLQSLETGVGPLPEDLQRKLAEFAQEEHLTAFPDERHEFASWRTRGRGWSPPRQDLERLSDADALLALVAADERDRGAATRGLGDLAASNPRRAHVLFARLVANGKATPAQWSTFFSRLGGESTDASVAGALGALATLAAQSPADDTGCLGALATWLKRAWTSQAVTERDETLLWTVFQHLWLRATGADATGEVDPDAAVRHPIGVLLQILLDKLAEAVGPPESGIPVAMQAHFDWCFEGEEPQQALGRIILARNLGVLEQVDRAWTRSVVVSRMNWDSSPDPRGHWEGFLSNPCASPSLWSALALPLASALPHLAELGPRGEALCDLFVSASIRDRLITPASTRSALSALRAQDLARVAQAVHKLLAAADPGAAQVMWRRRLLTWFDRCWPNSESYRSEDETIALAGLVVSVGGAASDALDRLSSYLRPTRRVVELCLDDGVDRLALEQPDVLAQLLDRLIPTGAVLFVSLRELVERLESGWPPHADRMVLGRVRARLGMV